MSEYNTPSTSAAVLARMLLAHRIRDHFSGRALAQPGLRMDRVAGLFRLMFLAATVATSPLALERLPDHPVLGSLTLAAYLAVIVFQVFFGSESGDQEDQGRQILFTAEILILTALVYLYGLELPAVFVLFLFPLAGFFQPVSIRSAMFTALFLAALYIGLLHVAQPQESRSGLVGTLLLLVGGITIGYLGEKGRWNSIQINMFRRCGEILKRDVSFDELLADLLKEIALYYPVERVILVSAEQEAGPARLKQARCAGGEVFYEEIEFLREEVQYLFPLELFSGFYINQVGRPDPDDGQYDFLENRVIAGRLELPKIFYTLFNVRSVLSSPILRHDRALGRLFLINRDQGRFTGKDIHFLKQLCDRHLRPVLENLQLMHKSQALAVLEERNRIAMDLHDSFIQTLATVDVRLEVGRRILERDVAAGLEEMRRISQMVKSEYLEVRRYMNKLRHHEPEGSKLEELLESFLHKFQEDHGLPVELAIKRSRGPLAGALRSEVLQIVREGLTNVVRHARATRAKLDIDVGDEAIKIRIEDDGQGMPVENGAGRNGAAPLRPWTILQRTQRLAGDLEVDSAPGEGTRISVSIPLRRNP
ncbi:MAG: GAF domain-containing sensor histidine kinase [Gemmatimonadota bacterium]